MAYEDWYRKGQQAYAKAVTPPSMKPRGMSEDAWRAWVRGWEDAQQQHADAEIREQQQGVEA